MTDVQSLRKAYEDAGQGHVFTFYDSLSSSDQESLLNQIANLQITPAEITKIANSAIEAHQDILFSTDPVDIKPLPSTSYASVVDSDVTTIDSWNTLGLDLISQNSVAVILLAGGQGTRLGSSAPKGCYDVGLPSHKSLFQLQAERIAKIQQLADKHANKPAFSSVVPWYIMTSGPTRKPTEDFFKANSFFGLNPANVIFFEQGVLPCFTPEGKIIMETPSKLAVAPDGNGGIYLALHRSGVLADLKSRGIQHIHTYCVDNCLVKVADPIFIGFSAEKKLDIATKVVRKRDAHESVGLIVSKNSNPSVIEYSEISKELAEATESSVNGESLLKFRAANIVNHYYSYNFLSSIPSWTPESINLPYHVANKKISYVDLESGDLIKPTQPNGIKLEQFVFDVFSSLDFSRFASLEVHREEEFSPLKNAPGTGSDDPETSRDDLLQQSTRWIAAVGASVEENGLVEVSPLTSYAGEGLQAFKGTEFKNLQII
ncbi:udp-n-acetylglucosamine pyrophosphorylase [Nadsonia fulvescens var. elongata DSM 6958]|uniref:UDP-N-acetylglucosamine diphosphorylase n=1 Tax=Nadsonia fulvescens var. elongata DSM 6958 TaxID=857566 RepID=A0A1E3PLP6_9ASCO|nr:udp-n-acetylglucosamine pyrophosphorylase [Nadsonia fulvescens var. elongata DSM 6958]